ncbi:MAG: glycosyltransferase [Methanobacterium paludis]|nr:glycosyltransferase [Methanobacterium paludis]
MKIVVVLPAYNEEKTVAEVMEELFNRGFELFVVDDGSVDGTYNIAKNIIDKKGKLEEVPIKTIYTPYALSKGTNLKVGLKILVKLIMNLLK